jgi:hypothetical protein
MNFDNKLSHKEKITLCYKIIMLKKEIEKLQRELYGTN